MPIEYLAYEEELQLLYRRSKEFSYGQCIEIHGLPGAGLSQFVQSFVRTYAPAMEKENIYCCVVQCPKDRPDNLFVCIIDRLHDLFHAVFRQEPSTQAQRSALQQLEDCSLMLHKMNASDKVAYQSFETYFLMAINACASLCKELNVRLFITRFDNARFLFAKDVSYAMLFKLMCENYTDFLGVIIADHRTLSVIALVVEAFSEFASLFNVHIPLQGFNSVQTDSVFKQMEGAFHLLFDDSARGKLQYYCGRNPQRFEMMFSALENLKSDLSAEQWSKSTAEDLVEQAYHLCFQQMNEQIMRMIRSIQDIRGDGLGALAESLNNPFAQRYDFAREALFHMQILTNQNGPTGKAAVMTIPVMEETIKRMAGEKAKTKTPHKGRSRLRILHLSDMHFDSKEDETSAELRKAYLRNFCKKLTILCNQAPVDYIFITGDIGWSGQTGDYEMAKKFILNLLQICELEPNRLFLCPGNHDLKRSLVEDIHYPTTQREADQYLTLPKLERNGAAFQNYTRFCKELGCVPYEIGQHFGYLTGIQVCQDFIVTCLNTSWFAMNEERSRVAWVGKNYIIAIQNKVDELREKICRPVITLMHYPANTWAEEDRSSYKDTINSWELVSQMSDVVLCGHTHEMSDMNCIINDAKVFTSGAFYDSQEQVNRFCIYELTHSECKKEEYIYMKGKWYLTPNER